MQRPFSLDLIVPESEFDNEYHHLHHAAALRFLEMARLGFLEALGFPNEWFIRQGILLVVLQLEVTYWREVKGSCIRATCETAALEGRDIVIDQVLYNERGKKAIGAKVRCVGMLAATRRACDVPDPFVAALQGWLAPKV